MSRDCPQGTGAPSRPRGVCYDWQKGICQRGMACRFSHQNDGAQGQEGMMNDGQAPPQQQGFQNNFGGQQGYQARPRGACYDWQKGMCNRGASCRFSHDDNAVGGAGPVGNGGFSNFGGNNNGEGGNYSSVRPGDWQCPGCQINNFASRIQCFKCNTAKGAEAVPGQQQPEEECPSNFRRSSPVAASQIRTVLSSDPETMDLPSGEKATENTEEECPSDFRRSSPVVGQVPQQQQPVLGGGVAGGQTSVIETFFSITTMELEWICQNTVATEHDKDAHDLFDHKRSKSSWAYTAR